MTKSEPARARPGPARRPRDAAGGIAVPAIRRKLSHARANERALRRSFFGSWAALRVQDIAGEERFAACRAEVDRLIERYEEFLDIMDAPEGDPIARVMNPAESARLTAGMNEFGDLMWELLKAIGEAIGCSAC